MLRFKGSPDWVSIQIFIGRSTSRKCSDAQVTWAQLAFACSTHWNARRNLLACRFFKLTRFAWNQNPHRCKVCCTYAGAKRDFNL